MILVWAIVGNSASEVKGEQPTSANPLVCSDPSEPDQDGIEILLELIRQLCGPLFCSGASVQGIPEIDAIIASYRAHGVNPSLTPAERSATVALVNQIEQSIPDSMPASQRAELLDALEDIVHDLQS